MKCLYFWLWTLRLFTQTLVFRQSTIYIFSEWGFKEGWRGRRSKYLLPVSVSTEVLKKSSLRQQDREGQKKKNKKGSKPRTKVSSTNLTFPHTLRKMLRGPGSDSHRKRIDRHHIQNIWKLRRPRTFHRIPSKFKVSVLIGLRGSINTLGVNVGIVCRVQCFH